MSSSVPISEPRYLQDFHFVLLHLLIWCFSVLLLLMQSPSLHSILGTTLSTWFILASSEWMKVMSSAYFGSISIWSLSLSTIQSNADHRSDGNLQGIGPLGIGLMAYARYSMNSRADKQSPWQIPIAVSISAPTLSPIFTFRMTSFLSRYTKWSSLGVKMFLRISISWERFTVSKALDIFRNRIKMS